MGQDAHKREQRLQDRPEGNTTPLFVLAKVCDECLFSSKRLVDKERADEIIAECRAKNTHFICHKASINGYDKNVCCYSYYNRVGSGVLEIRLAHALGLVLFVREDEIPLLPDRLGTATTQDIDMGDDSGV